MSISIGYFGSPSHSAKLLGLLLGAGITVDFVVTNPDRPAGRKKELTPTPVKQLAAEHSIPVIQSERLRLDEVAKEKICSYPSSIHIVYAYGSIIPEAVFQFPKYGSINLHGSLLPKYRGASPVQSFLLSGETVSGFTIQHLAKEVDSGDIAVQESWEVGQNETTEDLLDAITFKGVLPLIDMIRNLESKPLPKIPQDHSLATHCRKIGSEDRSILWTRSAFEIHNQVRALYPDPLAYTVFREKRVIINRTFFTPDLKPVSTNLPPGSFLIGEKKRLFCVCGDGNLLGIETLQPEGKKPMSGFDFFNGARASLGETFT
ncbi:methionyl-tRNA formyltransferase [Leptospira ilyithenensis]|uniref:Methionyl-tRNA formyltransferase n=1 Tax=Leptospira ilyithenensis TaxID=2484901 RepID=A0A4R9LKY2_9LEPT|nr:methionyl-tRNA formyltransferase [Leptospira ilyithenensis]TGN08255.1 methionyl-tRNA formyltransferase [Leptospira ilyithenensis]